MIISDPLRLITIAALTHLTISQAQAARMIGYWDNWGTLPLGQVSRDYDVVMLAFADSNGTDGATIDFHQNVESASQFTDDIKTLKSHGVHLLVSIGAGGALRMNLQNKDDVNTFVSSTEAVIDKYGIDGVDLDLENGIIATDQGDNDINHPTTPNIVNLIKALHQLHAHYGDRLMITAAPEGIAMNGYDSWGVHFSTDWNNAHGGHISLINCIRDILTFVAPQYYDAGTFWASDNRQYSEGTPDFDVSQADLLLHGYTLVTGQYFPPLRPDQVVIGMPATKFDASYIPPDQVLQAAKYIGSGTSFGGKYKLSSDTGYPNFGGVMMWDINADSRQNYAMANALAPYLHSLLIPVEKSKDASPFSEPQHRELPPTKLPGELPPRTFLSDRAAFGQTAMSDTIIDHLPQPTIFALEHSSLDYSLDAESLGKYNVNIMASSNQGATLHFRSLNGYELGPAFIIPSSDTPTSITGTAQLVAGKQLIQLYVDDGKAFITGIMFTNQKPDTPSSMFRAGLNGTNRKRLTTDLFWIPSESDAAYYNVFRGTAPGKEDYSHPVATCKGPKTADAGCTASDPTVAPNSNYYYTVQAVNSTGSSAPSKEVTISIRPPSAYKGAPARIPGIICLDNYDEGGQGSGYYVNNSLSNQGKAYRDDLVSVEPCTDDDHAGNGFDIGYTNTGNWLAYTVDVAAAGKYTVTFRVSGNGGKIHLADSAGKALTGPITVPTTGGWQTWTSVSATVTLVGVQDLYLYEDTGGFNIEYIKFEAASH